MEQLYTQQTECGVGVSSDKRVHRRLAECTGRRATRARVRLCRPQESQRQGTQEWMQHLIHAQFCISQCGFVASYTTHECVCVCVCVGGGGRGQTRGCVYDSLDIHTNCTPADHIAHASCTGEVDTHSHEYHLTFIHASSRRAAPNVFIQSYDVVVDTHA